MAGISHMSPESYLAIKNALHETRNNVSKTAKMVGRNRQTITKALREGWPQLGLPPIAPPAMAEAPATTTTLAPTKEQQAISTQINNLLGNSVAVSKALAELVQQAPLVLAKIAADGGIEPAQYVHFVRELGKTQAQTSAALAQLMAASRLSEGRAQTISEVQHSGSVGVEVGVHVELSADAARARIEEMIDSHARARSRVPGRYQGEISGFGPGRAEAIDVEAVEAEDDAAAVG